jgi:hypothetical protein
VHLLHRFDIHFPYLLLDQTLLLLANFFRLLWLIHHQGLLNRSRYLLLVLFARFLTKLMGTCVLFLDPSSTALARSSHHSNRHACKPSVFFMKSLNFFESFNLHVKCFNFLHKLEFSRATMDVDPLEMLWQLNAFVKWHIYSLICHGALNQRFLHHFRLFLRNLGNCLNSSFRFLILVVVVP